MKNRIIEIVAGMILLLFSSLSAQITFERWYGGNEWDAGYSVMQTTDGGYIIVGGTESFNADSEDVYLIRTDPFGDTLWTKIYGGSNVDGGNCVAQTSDGGFIIVGATQSFGNGSIDVYLIKVDTIGDTVWTKTYGGISYDWGRSVLQLEDDGYIIIGSTYSYGMGLGDFYLIRTDSLGDTIWTKTYGGVDWERGNSIAQTSNGGFIIVGYTYSFGAGQNDVYLIRVDSLGDTLWTRTYGGVSWDGGYSVIQTLDGGYIVAGNQDSSGVSDVFLVKTDSSGDTLWTRTHGGTQEDYGMSIVQTSDKGYAVAGWTYPAGQYMRDVYLIKTDSLGDTLWTRTFGDTAFDNGSSICKTLDNGFIIVGGTESFGSGREDVYLIKTDAYGNIGIQEKEDPRPETRDIRLKCHPNPFTSYTTVILPSIELGAEGMGLHIYDATGRLVKSIILESSTYQLGADLVPGIYFIKLNGKPVGKVVKVK